MTAKRFSPWVTRALVLALSTLVSYLLLELGLWLVAPVPEGYVVMQTYQQQKPGLQPTITIRSEFGLRARSLRSRAKPPGTIRIFCLGASTTEEISQNIDDTWSGQLELALQKAFPATRIEVAAWAAGGRKSTAAVRYAATEMTTFDPDIVVTLFGINELCWNGGPNYRADQADAEIATPSPRSQAAQSWLFRWSQVARRLRAVRDNLQNTWLLWRGRAVSWEAAQMPNLQAKHRGSPYVAAPVRPNDPFPDFEATMRRLLQILKDQHRATVVLGQPVLWKESMSQAELDALWFWLELPTGPVRPSTGWLLAEMQRYNAAQRRLAGEAGAAFVDLDAQVPKDLAHYFDDCHYTDLGSRTVADAVFPTLKTAVGSLIARRTSSAR